MWFLQQWRFNFDEFAYEGAATCDWGNISTLLEDNLEHSHVIFDPCLLQRTQNSGMELRLPELSQKFKAYTRIPVAASNYLENRDRATKRQGKNISWIRVHRTSDVNRKRINYTEATDIDPPPTLPPLTAHSSPIESFCSLISTRN